MKNKKIIALIIINVLCLILSVMKAAFPSCDVSETDNYLAKPSTFVRHYHARNIIDYVVDFSHFSIYNKIRQQYFTPHSYFLY